MLKYIAAMSITQSHPSWRWIALASWVLLALAFLALFLIDLRLDYLQLLKPCQGADCNWMAITPAEVDVLASWGLSTRAYAAFMTGTAILTVAIYWLLGGLILVRLGTTRIGLAISLVFLAIPIALISDPDNLYTNFPALLLPSIFLQSFGTIFLLLFLYLFPNGRFYPRWASIPLAASVVIVFIRVILEVSRFTFMSPVQIVIFQALVILIILGPFFQIMRYRHDSSPIEHQQIRWTLFGFSILVLSFPLWLLIFGRFMEIPPGMPRLLSNIFGWIIIQLLLVALPISIAIAILRYRLWDIDVIIRRTLVYGALTATLALVYFGSVMLLQNLFTAVSGQQSAVAVVISTLIIAALFTPLRRRIQNDIDRRFYRRKYDAEKTLENFAVAVRNEVELEQLTVRLLSVVEETLQPEHGELWLRNLSAQR
jgi:hypothetical protein